MELKKLPKRELEYITNEAVMETLLDDKFENYFQAISTYSDDKYIKDEHSVDSNNQYLEIKKKIDDFLGLKDISLPKTKILEEKEKKNNISAYILVGGAAINSYCNPWLSAFLLAEYFALKRFWKKNPIDSSHYIPLLRKINLLDSQNTNDTFAHEYGHHISSKVLPFLIYKKYDFFSEGFSEYIGKFELDKLDFHDFKDIYNPSKLMIYKKYKKNEKIENDVEKCQLILTNSKYECGLLFFRLFHQVCGNEVTKNLLVKPSESFKELDIQIKSFDVKDVYKNCNSGTNMQFLLEREMNKKKKKN